MSHDQAAPPLSIVKRTLTIITTETWTITLGPAFETADRPTKPGSAQDIIDQSNDPISQGNQREQS